MTFSVEEPYKIILSGEEITIRPIKGSDIDLECDFIKNLSSQAKHYRFLGGVNQLSPNQLRQLCDIDFEHRIAFIAVIDRDGKEEQIGVSRYAQAPASDNYEFAVTVADQWKHKKVDKILVEKLMAFAKKHHIKRLFSINMADDNDMRELAGDLGMKVERDPDDASQVIYSVEV